MGIHVLVIRYLYTKTTPGANCWDHYPGTLSPLSRDYNSLEYRVKEMESIAGLVLGLHPANERRRYKVTPSVIGWTQT